MRVSRTAAELAAAAAELRELLDRKRTDPGHRHWSTIQLDALTARVTEVELQALILVELPV